MSSFITRQPGVGLLGTAIVSIVSLIIISLLDFKTFTGPVAFVIMTIVPAQLLIGMIWHGEHPKFAAGEKQPVKGFYFLGFSVVAGALLGIAMVVGIGGGMWPPTPMLAMYEIFSVIVAFWVFGIWQAWPVTAIVKQPFVAGIIALILNYLIAYGIFCLCYDFSFMAGAPVYVEAQDPKGLFNAWHVQVFGISTIAALLLLVNFEMWPFTRSPALMQQPVFGIVLSLFCVLVGGGSYYLFVHVMNMDVADYMVRIAITFIFGTIIVQNMLQGSLFASNPQPLKGMLATAHAALLGFIMFTIFEIAAPSLSGEMTSGPPTYQFEIWMASALLGITFPLLIVAVDFFGLWPMKSDDD
jgi:hypothetical protein